MYNVIAHADVYRPVPLRPARAVISARARIAITIAIG